MSLEVNLRNGFTRIATEFKNANTRATGTTSGALTGLATTNKTNLIAAINEVRAAALSASGGGVTLSQVDDRIALVVGAAPAALDTLAEFAAAIGNDTNFAATTTTALNNRLRFDVVQATSAPQKTQGLANLGAAPVVHNHDTVYFTKTELGDVTVNFVTHFEAGLV